MSSWGGPAASWLAEIYLLSTIILIVAVLAMCLLNQPARRLAVARSALISLGLIAPLAFGSKLVRPRWADDGPPPVAPPPVKLSGLSCACGSPLLRSAPISSPPVPLGKGTGAVLAAFGFGSCAISAWLGLGAIASVRLTGQTKEAPDRLVKLLRRIVGETSRPPRLLLSEAVSEPVAVGAIRPSIVLPVWFARSEPEDRIKAALAHEWAHIRNGDLWLVALGRLLLPLMFAQPLFVLLRRRIRADQEALADAEAVAIGGRVAYAEALLCWARSCRDRGAGWLAPEIGLLGRRSMLLGRVALVLDREFVVEPRCPRIWRLAVRGTSTAILMALAMVSIIGKPDPGHSHRPGPINVAPRPILDADHGRNKAPNISAFHCSK